MKYLWNREEFLGYVSKYLPQNSTCAEIGVFNGELSGHILNHINPRKLYLIDPWEEGSDKNGESPVQGFWDTELGRETSPELTAHSNEKMFQSVKNKFSKEIKEKKVVLKKGFSYDVVSSFPDNYFDFIYIDACHLYGCVKADLEMFWPKMKEGGLVCGHDFHETFPGVIQAVNEFQKKHGLNIFAFCDHTDWALTPKKGKTQKTIPIVMGSWLNADITKRCLSSLNSIEGIKPEIYIWQNHSANYKEIDKVILNSDNIKKYIRFKENFVASGLIAMDYFSSFLNDEDYIVWTDGDMIIYSDSIRKQLNLFEEIENVGIVSQRVSPIGKSVSQRENDGHYYSNGIIEELNGCTRSVHNGFGCCVAKLIDWKKYIHHAVNQDVKFKTMAWCNMQIWEERPPLFFDSDIFRFFENVMGKKSLILDGMDYYELSQEEKNNPDKVYEQEQSKRSHNVLDYIKNPKYHHSKFYANKELKYEIIK